MRGEDVEVVVVVQHADVVAMSSRCDQEKSTKAHRYLDRDSELYTVNRIYGVRLCTAAFCSIDKDNR